MLMIPARLVRSESFWAVVKVRSPHTGPGIRYIIQNVSADGRERRRRRQNPQVFRGDDHGQRNFGGRSAAKDARALLGAGCSPTAPGRCLHFECRGAPARVPGVEMRGSPPLAPPLCVCGDVYLTLPYLPVTEHEAAHRNMPAHRPQRSGRASAESRCQAGDQGERAHANASRTSAAPTSWRSYACLRSILVQLLLHRATAAVSHREARACSTSCPRPQTPAVLGDAAEARVLFLGVGRTTHPSIFFGSSWFCSSPWPSRPCPP